MTRKNDLVNDINARVLTYKELAHKHRVSMSTIARVKREGSDPRTRRRRSPTMVAIAREGQYDAAWAATILRGVAKGIKNEGGTMTHTEIMRQVGDALAAELDKLLQPSSRT